MMCGKSIRATILFINTFINEIDDLMALIWRRRRGRRGYEEGEEVPWKKIRNSRGALKLDININYFISIWITKG